MREDVVLPVFVTQRHVFALLTRSQCLSCLRERWTLAASSLGLFLLADVRNRRFFRARCSEVQRTVEYSSEGREYLI